MENWIKCLVFAALVGAESLSSSTNSTEITSSDEDAGSEESPSFADPHHSLFTTNYTKTIVVEIVEVEQDTILPCEIDGNPKPNRFTWMKNGEKIKQNTTFNFYEGSSLRITSLNGADSGEYKCIACNNLGCKDSTLTFRAFYKMEDDAMRNMTVMVNSTAIFYCDLDIRPIKSFSYRLFKGKLTEMKHLMDLWGTSDLLDTGKLLILDHVKLEDSGWYTCVACRHYLDNIYEVIGHKSAYLHVITKSESNHSIWLLMILIALIVLTVCIVIVKFGLRRNNKKYYPRWIKKVTVTKNLENTSVEEFQMPVVNIHRSMIIENQIYDSTAVSEYEYPTDWEWEVQRCRISIGKLLGEGAFGQVVLGQAFGFLKGGQTLPVAVKMLKDNHLDDDVKNLVCELEIMKMVGKHPNVINLLGCCTEAGPLYVIMEHAIHGNLKNFLQDHSFSSTNSEKKTITRHELVSFASQIVSGMVYLSSIKCVHRDLAARNILVGEGLVMKISDFGLARDVHHQEYYRKLTGGRMPIRWMAPESLEFRFFDTKSDVWSFGVLFWEIMTLGGQPYQFLAAGENLLEYLKQGHRLEQPRSCPDEIYLVMKQCWQSNSKQRPSFIEIEEHLNTCIHEVMNVKDD